MHCSMLLIPFDFSADRINLVHTFAPDTIWACFLQSLYCPWELLSAWCFMRIVFGLHSALPVMALRGHPLSGPAYFDLKT